MSPRKDHDLPDPVPRRPLTRDEVFDRRWQLYQNLFIFAALYGALHKIAIPFVLSQTTVLVQDYTKIDWWALPALSLALYLFRFRRRDALVSLMAGGLVAYAIWDARAIFLGYHKGWLAWSHALSSIPQGLMAIALLTMQKTPRTMRWSWMGAVLSLGLLMTTASSEMSASGSGNLPMGLLPASKTDRLSPISDCGAQEFSAELETIPRGSKLRIAECGFTPRALIFVGTSPLVLERDNGETLNLHIVFYNLQGKRTRQSNRLINSGEKRVKVSSLSFESKEVAAILYSDTRPQIGKSLILSQEVSDIKNTVVGVGPGRTLVWRPQP